MTTIGSLFTGYGGLDMAVRMALDTEARVAWISDVEPGPCRLAEVRWPGVPNLGDITQVDWSEVEPVDIICGGSPCQDLSLAGRRAGMAPGTRSGLWESMFEATKTLRPRLAVWENVRGSLTSGAFSLVESEQGLLGVGADGPALRAAGRVVGDLASAGYDAQWCVVRTSDVGAPHQEGTGMSLSQAFQMLPTPQATNATASSAGYGANLHEVSRGMEVGTFGVYEQAIARWESVLGRPAPSPTVPPTREGGASASLNSLRRVAHGLGRWVRHRGGSRADTRAAAPIARKRRRPTAGSRCDLPAHNIRA